eukprot:gnl/MRDRNA2_/MRDRNA2_94132_c0_seq1.p1 gnl/MRDRNA2_/MRDRNA2_94132_c0~~gnl/MRDRNA2_/MRDRNA2_94132_c0_seq1.p1  ORF type:complete len:492 (+),score=109.47 gnl/MRDRNA2_/MRDRNA2_94132_c0_seq1:88-1563(+)
MADSDKDPQQSMREMLASKGYDIVEGDSDSSDDGFGIPGRMPSMPPALAKEKGNEKFKKGKYDKAIKYWQAGLKSILSALCAGPEAMGDQTLSELDLSLNLNIAMALTKKGDFDGAVHSCGKALARRASMPPAQVAKALYRKANAQKSLGRLDQCLETLTDCLEEDPNNAAAKQMFQEVDREWKKQTKKQENAFKKMWAKLDDETTKEGAAIKAARAEARTKCGVKWLEGDVDSEKYELGKLDSSEEYDGQDWGKSLVGTVLWGIEQFSVEGHPVVTDETCSMSVWFLGVSSTCELRWCRLDKMIARLPHVTNLEVTLIGFLGELDPGNKRVPDPKAEGLSEEAVSKEFDGGSRTATLRCLKGTLQDVLEGPHSDTLGVPTVCVIAHPQFHRYYTDFYPAMAWLIQKSVPTIIVGASAPDPSWNQDEILIPSYGSEVVVTKRESPYPMKLPDDPKVRKCNHIYGFKGGKALEKDKLTKKKLDLLAQDYTLR